MRVLHKPYSEGNVRWQYDYNEADLYGSIDRIPSADIAAQYRQHPGDTALGERPK